MEVASVLASDLASVIDIFLWGFHVNDLRVFSIVFMRVFL